MTMPKNAIALILICGLLSACANRFLGDDLSCANLRESVDRAECFQKNKKIYREYDQLRDAQKGANLDAEKEATSTTNDSLCYQNPRAGEKACAK